MTTPTAVVQALDVPAIGHEEAMDLARVEDERLLALLRTLTPDDWTRPTDCTRWRVRELVQHLIGSAAAQASPVELVRQVLLARRLRAQVAATHWVDTLNEAQIRRTAAVGVDDAAERWRSTSAAALRARRRLPAPVRALRVVDLGEAMGTRIGRQRLDYLFDTGFTRDTWMHRVDLARAVDRPLVVTAEHDGRIVAGIVAEWARLHDEPFTLHLGGPAGGRYTARGGGEPVEVDAVEFCRILSGRAAGHGVLRHALPL
ncbi:maleylpyruvate isomerase family mycothiol-dependent enzyme [Kineococcus sp. SYSU DK006]|uniref:maleylpyruvate isomerase family mycothiol-dependent enzyme n=1 Tax=Kineococcus sp. SYSU DK006 TaxID=3383127 RepID=UPI003D7C413F